MPFPEPPNPDYASAVRASFAMQGFMRTIGASLTLVEPGAVHIDLPFAAQLTQHDGLIHAGVIASLADNACGYAALSLAPSGCNVLAVEFKINLLSPARAPRFQARGRVIRSGRTLTIAQADVFGVTETQSAEDSQLVATMVETVFVKNAG
jgi:uncharacterized protein (TIGR00369 family)